MSLQRTSVNESLDNYIDELAAAFETKPRSWDEDDSLDDFEEEEEEVVEDDCCDCLTRFR